MRFFFIVFLLTFPVPAYCQQFYDPQIHIGQPADSVQTIAGKDVQTYYNAGGWLMKLNAQTIDYKGTLKEVIFCKENILIPYFNKGVNVCTHFVMERDTLCRIMTEYKNLSLQEVKYLMVVSRRINMTDYYFDPDWKSYHHVYTGADGFVVDDFRKTRKEQLPLGVLEQLHMIADKW